MSNVSFRYTLADLRECYQWLSKNDPDKLPREELIAYKQFIKLCKTISEDYA